ncbi:MAG: elongation factor Ts [Oleiphilaceae bacterium]|jgi:elongation factor Ts
MAAISASLVKELRDRTGLGMMECKKALVASNGDVEQAIEEMRKNSGMKAAKKAGRTAADGIVAAKISADGKSGVLVEINSETDFAARDTGFLAFVDQVVDKVAESNETDVAKLMEGDLEKAREALVQKIGENISVRRIVILSDAVVGQYIHSTNRIGVLVALNGGDAELAKDIAMHVAAVNPQFIKQSEVSEELIEKEKEIFTAQAEQSGKPAEIIQKMIGGRISKYLAEICLLDQPFVKSPEVKVGGLVKKAGAEVIAMIRFEVGEGIEKEVVSFADEVAAQLKG